MEDYELILGSIMHYKIKACGCANNQCEKCEAMYQYNDKQHCQFDTVMRFIEWDNKYNR